MSAQIDRKEADGLFDDIDGAVILRLLPEKIKLAEERYVNTALDLEALYVNKYTTDEERQMTERAAFAQRFQLEYLKNYLARIEAAVNPNIGKKGTGSEG